MSEIKKDMYDLNYSENFNLVDTQEQVIDISLENTKTGTCTINGTVLDQTGNPVEGATIKLFDSNGVPYMHTLTNSIGKYNFSGLKNNSYAITCVKDKIVLTSPKIYFYKKTK